MFMQKDIREYVLFVNTAERNYFYIGTTRPLQIAYKTALSESLIWSTIHIAYTSAPFTQSTLLSTT